MQDPAGLFQEESCNNGEARCTSWALFHWKIHRLGVSYARLGEDIQNETMLTILLMWSFSVSVLQKGLLLHIRFWDLCKGVLIVDNICWSSCEGDWSQELPILPPWWHHSPLTKIYFLLIFLLHFLSTRSWNDNLLFSSVQLLSHVWLFATPWTTACQASLSITNSRSSHKPMSLESVMASNHLILCHPLLLLPSIFPSIRVFSNESA